MLFSTLWKALTSRHDLGPRLRLRKPSSASRLHGGRPDEARIRFRARSVWMPCEDARMNECRVVPLRSRRPATHLWKFWVSGNEVYAVSRTSGGVGRVAIHGSGKIHFHLAGRDLQDMAPPIPLEGSGWVHALEVRFLISDRALRPARVTLKGKRWFGIEVPSGA